MNVEPFFEFLSASPLLGVYFLCAAFGGTLILFQMFLMMFGIGGGETDTDFGDDAGDHSSADIFKVLSFRTLTAGIAFFGIGGLAGWSGGLSPLLSFFVAVISGLISIYAVYYLYRSVAQLKDDGSLSEKTLVGSTGSVYVRIPSAKSGAGKVLVTQQGRTVEYEAVTAGEELKSGSQIVVVGIVSSTTVEVVASHT